MNNATPSTATPPASPAAGWIQMLSKILAASSLPLATKEDDNARVEIDICVILAICATLPEGAAPFAFVRVLPRRP